MTTLRRRQCKLNTGTVSHRVPRHGSVCNAERRSGVNPPIRACTVSPRGPNFRVQICPVQHGLSVTILGGDQRNWVLSRSGEETNLKLETAEAIHIGMVLYRRDCRSAREAKHSSVTFAGRADPPATLNLPIPWEIQRCPSHRIKLARAAAQLLNYDYR